MQTIINIKEANSFLEKNTGLKAQIWLFDVSLKRLALRLSKGDTASVIYVVAVGCDFISGAFSWDDSKLIINEEKNKFSETIVRMVDKKNHFQLISSSITIAYGLESEFGRSFDHFLNESKTQ